MVVEQQTNGDDKNVVCGVCFCINLFLGKGSGVRRRWQREGKSIDGCVNLRYEEIFVYLCMDDKACVSVYG